MSRFLGVFVAAIAAIVLYMTYEKFSWVTLGVGLALLGWDWSGWIKIIIGWKGQLTFLGERIETEPLLEGWRWVPEPWGVITIDCRKQVMKLDTLKAVTSDGVEMSVSVTVSYRVQKPFAHLGVETSSLKKWIDDNRDQIARREVRGLTFEQSQDAKSNISDSLKKTLGEGSEEWGVEILEVAIPEIIATDPGIRRTQELKAKEKLETSGQREEARNFARMVRFFKSEKGGKLSHDQAVLQANLTTGKSSPTNTNELKVSPEVLTAAAEILKGLK